jgi:hypothetical protein
VMTGMFGGVSFAESVTVAKSEVKTEVKASSKKTEVDKPTVKKKVVKKKASKKKTAGKVVAKKKITPASGK